MDNHKIAWVSWEPACLSKEKGGLGIRDLTKFNQALLGMWKGDLFHPMLLMADGGSLRKAKNSP